jgi:preprotein translocase subunit SecA
VRDTQLHAAQAMLANAVVELATGEGKTVVAVLAAAVGALASVPVHVLSSNDYLAARDAAVWAPVYRALGLSVDAIQPQDDAARRRQVYRCDVAYASARELAFDHLRDRLAVCTASDDVGVEPVLRGLCMAVLDEADSVLVDEATVPMILSAPVPDDQVQRHRVALFLARQLSVGEQALEAPPGQWQLTEPGRDWLAARAPQLGPDWRMRRLREELVTTALAVLYSFTRDVHYVVHDGEIQIVDSHTGRRAQGRSWSRGIHQLIAIKEGLAPAPLTETVQQLSYQQLFPRYLRLCGQSGTVWEARHELMAVYGLPVVRIAPHQPSRRVDRGTHVCPTDAALWAGVARRAQGLQDAGLPVLIGTGSVAASNTVSQALTAIGVVHRVLNASQDADEATVVATAGAAGVVTVATQMAGRGTDIPVDDTVAQRGGLHVLAVGLQAARRTERQLAGRAGRKGQPGSHERWLSLADDALGIAPRWRAAAQGLARWLPPVFGLWLSWRQGRESRRGQAQRWRMLQAERRQAAQLAWAAFHPWDR